MLDQTYNDSERVAFGFKIISAIYNFVSTK